MSVIAVDFDGVIHNPEAVLPGKKMGIPISGAAEALNKLAERHQIVIHTTWATTEQRVKAIHDWCEYFHVPHYMITSQKPEAAVYLDDKALRFTDWDSALQSLSDMLPLD